MNGGRRSKEERITKDLGLRFFPAEVIGIKQRWAKGAQRSLLAWLLNQTLLNSIPRLYRDRVWLIKKS